MTIPLTIKTYKGLSQAKVLFNMTVLGEGKTDRVLYLIDQLCPRIKKSRVITIKQAAESCLVFLGPFKYSSYHVRI